MVEIIFERMFPADENRPGATEVDVINYVDKALAGPYSEKLEWYRLGLAALKRAAWQRYGTTSFEHRTMMCRRTIGTSRRRVFSTKARPRRSRRAVFCI